MRVKREYLTDELPQPKVTERLDRIEKILNELLARETEPEDEPEIETEDDPEDEGPTMADIMDRLSALAQKVERLAAAPPAPSSPPPPLKQPYQFDVVRNASGGIDKIVARPLTGKATIYEGRH